MKSLTLLVCALMLTGCGVAPFEVERLDTSFSENKNAVYIGKNNRISTKSIAGGMHIDSAGVFVNPFVERDATSGNVVALGLHIVNVTDYDTTTGGVNQLGTIEQIAFRLSDGRLITLETSGRERRSYDTLSYNSVSRSASYGVREYATVTLEPDELNEIAAADELSVKITGARQSVVYETDDLSPSFQANLRTFYDQHVASEP